MQLHCLLCSFKMHTVNALISGCARVSLELSTSLKSDIDDEIVSDGVDKYWKLIR